MQFYIIQNGTQQGPFDKSQLPELGILADTMVWYEGLPDWVPAAKAPETMFLFENAGPAMNGASDFMSQGPQMPPHPQQPYQQYPQYQQGAGGMPPCPSNYLVWSILATIFCCLPLGIVAIVKGASVNSEYNRGDYEGAMRTSRSTRNWVIAAAVCGLVWGVLSVIYALLVGTGTLFATAASYAY